MLKLLAVAVTTIILTASTPKEPQLKCTFGAEYNYTAINPLLDPIEMVIDCGPDFEITKLKMSPGTREELSIKTADGHEGICHLDSWKRVK
jgi:hypothetical protein